jgi:hypothetical protein
VAGAVALTLGVPAVLIPRVPASAILWTYRADAAMEELSAAGLTEITCLTHQSLTPD